MYAVITRDHTETWSLESRHRLFARAQDSARRLTSAKYALRNVRTCHHHNDVMIVRWNRGAAPLYLGPQSHEY